LAERGRRGLRQSAITSYGDLAPHRRPRSSADKRSSANVRRAVFGLPPAQAWEDGERLLGLVSGRWG